jgi:hypothetical protein
MNPLGRRIYD